MNKHSVRTAIVVSLGLFLLISTTSFLTMSLTMLMHRLGLLRDMRNPVGILVPVVTSILVGSLVSRKIGKRPVQVIEEISRATKAVAQGDFTVQLTQSMPVEEFQDVVCNFNTMTRQLAATEMLRNDFVENVSHEFKTPLTAIEGYATLLQKPGLSEEKRAEYTRKILSNTRRLNSLTGHILLLSRLENQETKVKKESYSLDEQLRECILLQENSWSGKGLEMDIELEDQECRANRDLMAHVWQNILSNAIKFTPEGGTIRVQLRKTSSALEVTVKDSGCGMTEEEQQHMFEKFYQGDRSRSTQGNGLGLALAKRIMDLHDGTIIVLSKEGAGTTFVMQLPADSEPSALL